MTNNQSHTATLFSH